MSQKNNIFSDEWCDMVFVDRNKEYGAYHQRKLSNKRHLYALIFASTFFILAITSPMIIKSIIPEKKVKMEEVTVLTNVKLDKPKENKIIEDVPPPPQLKSSIKFTAPVIKADKDVRDDEIMKNQDDLNKDTKAISNVDVKGNNETTGEIAKVVVKQEAPEEEQKPFLVVEQMPEFPGGYEEMMKFLRDNIKYPQMAKETGIQGNVIVQFVVNKDGRISNVKVLRGIGGGCDEEALRVVKAMPSWKPGKQNGQSVPVYFNLPIRFTLK